MKIRTTISIAAGGSWPDRGAPIGSAFERQEESGPFVQIDGDPWDPSESTPSKKWPPPGFPLVKGDHPLNEAWSMFLPEPFCRRVEEGSLVLWRPGLTLWVTAWNNDRGESQARRLAGIKKSASKDRHSEHEARTDHVTRYRYRLLDESEDRNVESLYAFIINDREHLQIAVYFDKPKDEAKARELVDSVMER